MSFLEHLDELRKRIVRSCLAVAFGNSRDVLLDPADLQFHSRADAPGAAARRQADLHAAGRSVLALHHRRLDRGRRRRRAVHHVSGLDVHRARPVLERKADGVSVRVLYDRGFVAGAAFNHYVSFPFMMAFFASFNTPDLAFMPKLEDVFGLYTKMLLGMGIVFQMPTVVFFLAKLRLVSARFLLAAVQVRAADHLHRGRRHHTHR
jgi:hypothetical protein